MNALINILFRFFEVFGKLTDSLWGKVFVFLCPLAAFAYAFAQFIGTQMGYVAEQLLGLAGITLDAPTTTGINDALALVNAFIPLTYIFVVLNFMFVTWVTTSTIRLIKSFVPTVS